MTFNKMTNDVTPLMYACLNGDFVADSELIDINKIDYTGNTALSYALCNCNIDLVLKLIDKGADMNVSNVLNWAFNFDCIEAVLALIDRGININTYNNRGCTLLQYACLQNHDREIVKFIKLKAQVDSKSIEILIKHKKLSLLVFLLKNYDQIQEYQHLLFTNFDILVFDLSLYITNVDEPFVYKEVLQYLS